MDSITTALLGIIALLQVILILRSLFARTGESVPRDILQRLDSFATALRAELTQNRRELAEALRDNRTELSQSLGSMAQQNNQRLEAIRETVDRRLDALQKDNTAKLDAMRRTVDEKLHETLEKRLGESFRLVSERLEHVQKGLGEMQSLAAGVGDLKKVMSNVKTRGVLGEYQLEALLEQIMPVQQYAKNVRTREGSRDAVEFAVKIPDKNSADAHIWLPIDAKFPTEDYERLLAAFDAGDKTAVEECIRALAARIEKSARDIRDKYVDPPHTTDFAVLFLPFEGLYAEVLRIPGLFEKIQSQYKITITGPTTVAALLNSLQMGFRTLAIQKRSVEVWQVLGAVKSEFSKFGDIIAKARDKIDAARKELDATDVRTRSITRSLRAVEELPAADVASILGAEDRHES
jgi:DNA recombination protein RmuC